MKIEVDKDDLEIVMMCAMRYTYYRSSYVVEHIQDFIAKHCEKDDIDKFIKDIQLFLKDYKVGFSPSEWVIQSWENTIIKLKDKQNND